MKLKVEVRPTDFWGEAVYTVFVNGKEMTAEYRSLLPVYTRDAALEVADEIRENLS